MVSTRDIDVRRVREVRGTTNVERDDPALVYDAVRELRVAVIGLGVIGGSVLRRLAALGVECYGYDSDAATRDSAERAGYSIHSDPDSALAAADVAVIATPPSSAPSLCIRALTYPRVVVTELSSAKCGIASTVYQHIGEEERTRFVPSHPLAGSEKHGWRHSASNLFENATWVICVDEHGSCSLQSLVTVSRLVDAMGSHTIVLPSDVHDEAVAYSSHMPHIVANALIQAVPAQHCLLPFLLAGGSFRDMTRVAGASSTIWSEIIALNRAEVTRALTRVRSSLDEFACVIECASEGELESLWERGVAQRHHFQDIRHTVPHWVTTELPDADARGLAKLGLSGVFVRHLQTRGEDLACETLSANARESPELR